ncbi:MAG: hypothetical protein JWO57_256 [Pseudonocardiales bacterium]|jgi:hypothetical protein|nr:hypothetical protein [Pseudonocardiales bacterium]
MPRPIRAVAAAAGAVAAAALLTGCTKPTPKISVLGGGKVVTITPSTYCFDSQHCRPTTTLDLPTLTVAADDKVLIDVPRDVVSRGWQAQALSLDGKQQLGSSGPINDSHSYRVPSGVANGGAFIVQVDELERGTPDGSKWSFLVKVSLTKT